MFADFFLKSLTEVAVRTVVMEQQPSTIGDMIRRRRDALGLTQQQLADAIGMQRQSIVKYEAGGDPAGSIIEAIAFALSCQPGDLFPPVQPLSKRK